MKRPLLRKARRRQSPSVRGNQARVLRDGDEAFPAMLDAIRSARAYICLETYILRDDATGWEFATALADRARHGVEVSLMYDAIGSVALGSDYLDYLKEQGVRLAEYHPILPWRKGFDINRRNHRKQLVVDGRWGFLGGLNIGDEYRSMDGHRAWRDTHLCVEGPVVRKMLRLFSLTWLRQGGAPMARERYQYTSDPVGESNVRVLGNRRHHDRGAIHQAYVDAFASAREQILVTNSYFVPSPEIRRELVAAARRGVRVVLLLAGKSDVLALQMATRSYYRGLLDAGVELYEWHQTILHAKTAVVDRGWSTVGSYNLNFRSRFHNLECNVMVDDPSVAIDLERMFWEDIAESNVVDDDFLEARTAPEKMAGRFFSAFRYWL